MATVRALQQGSTGDWSMSKGIRSYILCCFANRNNSDNNKQQQPSDAGRAEEYEVVDSVDGGKPHSNGQAPHSADTEQDQLTHADRLSYGSVKPASVSGSAKPASVSGSARPNDPRRDDSSSDEDVELVRQRLGQTGMEGSEKVKATAAAMAETAVGEPPDDDSVDGRLAPATGARGSKMSLSTTLDDDPRLFDVADLRGKADEEPPHVSRFGSLHATISYDHAKGSLLVTVLRASHVPTKERGGSDSSRVHVVLLGSKKLREKTKIRSGDKPEFNETFRFKILPDDVATSAVRLRLYGCERMKRERLIGETVIRGGNIDLVTGTTVWYNLEPRSEMVGASGDDTGSLKSDSGGSASSVNSLQGGAPEILLGLAYNSATGRLQVEIIKGSNFRTVGTGGRPPDTYVKVQLLSFNGQEISRTKTSVRRGQPNPVFKESFMFQVASFQLSDVALMVSVFNKKSMKKKEMMGWCSLGHNNSGDEEAAHWSEMKESRGTHVNRWHTLVDS